MVTFLHKKKTIIKEPIYFKNRTVFFSVEGKPLAKQRPKATRQGGFVRIYTPHKTKNYEEKIKQTYLNTIGNIKLEGALESEVTGVFPIPKATPKAIKDKMINGEINHTKKPDCDNMGKIVFDALNNVAYDDDSSICKTYINKIYGEEPRVDIKISELDKERIDNQCVIFKARSYTEPIFFMN